MLFYVKVFHAQSMNLTHHLLLLILTQMFARCFFYLISLSSTSEAIQRSVANYHTRAIKRSYKAPHSFLFFPKSCAISELICIFYVNLFEMTLVLSKLYFKKISLYTEHVMQGRKKNIFFLKVLSAFHNAPCAHEIFDNQHLKQSRRTHGMKSEADVSIIHANFDISTSTGNRFFLGF